MKNIKKIISVFSCVICMMLIGTFFMKSTYAESNQAVNITVPSAITINYDEKGKGTVSNYAVSNTSSIPFYVSSLKVTSSNNWQLVPYSQNIDKSSKYLSMKLNNNELKSNTTNSFDKSIVIPATSSTALNLSVKDRIFANATSLQKAFTFNFYFDTDSYTLSFDTNGGSSVPSSSLVKTTGDSITLPTTTKNGYKLSGWKDENGNVYEAGKSYTISNKDVKLTAVWSDLDDTLLYGYDFNKKIAKYSDSINNIEFVTTAVPSNVETIDVSLTQDQGVLAYLDGTTLKVTTQRSVKPEKVVNVDGMFQDLTKLKAIKWNNIQFTSDVKTATWVFKNCSSLQSVTTPMLDYNSRITDITGIFNGCSSLTTVDTTKWNLSNNTNLSFVFSGCSNLTSLDVSRLNTSKVTDMKFMFNSCSSLTSLNVSKFDMSNVTSADYMFNSCSSLTSLDTANLYTPKLQSASYMFCNLKNVKELDLSKFDTSKITELKNKDKIFADMWNLEKITLSKNISFTSNDDYDGLLTKPSADYIGNSDGYWYDVNTNERYLPNAVPSNKATTYSAVRYTINYAGLDGISNPNTVTYITKGLTKDINIANPTGTKDGYTFAGWKVNGVSNPNTNLTLSGSTVTSDITLTANWKEISNTLTTGIKFNNAVPSSTTSIIFTNEVAPSDTSVTDLSLAQDNGIVGWSDGNKYYVSSQRSNKKIIFNPYSKTMFANKFYLSSITFNNIDTSKVTNMASMFDSCRNLTTLDLSNFDTSNVTYMYYMFFKCSKLTLLDLSNFDTSNVTDMGNMFDSCSSLTTLDVSSFDTSKVMDMSSMFDSCSKLSTLDLSNFDTSKVTSMHSMLDSCSNLTTLDLSNFDTSKVTNMGSMFQYCSNLTTLDLSNFDTSNVTYMSFMFNFCLKLTALDVSNFDTSNVTDMGSMFDYCSNLTTLDVSNFDTSNVTNMGYMFDSCRNLTSLNLSNFNTSKVTNMGYMFRSCSNLKTIYVSNLWNVNSISKSTDMFYECTKIKGQSGVTYNSSEKDKSMANYETGYLTLK